MNYLDKLAEKYYEIRPRRLRVTVGWCFVCIFLLTVSFGVYGIYCGGKALVNLCVTAWNAEKEKDIQEVGHMDAPEFAYKGGHREFPVVEKNPKRHINFARDFNDINDVQLAAAQRLGISPLASRDELETVKDKLVELQETKYYTLDDLTHSVPYLVPEAADFLTALGKLLQEYNGTHSRYIITSVLRTEKDIKRLSRGNVNATKNSCHCYGTTVDITYNRFDLHGKTNFIQLKADLARALYDMQHSGHCYVKYEYKQACFHITVRPK